MPHITSEIKFNSEGLVPVIAQEIDSNEILMQAWANQEAVEHTLKTGKATYFSRSRNRLWCKGEESGNFQEIREIRIDCDGDALLYRVEQKGVKAACHTGHKNCFYRAWQDDQWKEIDKDLVFDPQNIYRKKTE